MLAVNGIFRDQHGRHLIPHGLNMVHKTSAELPWRKEDFAFARRIGSTLVRLGVIWAYLEPEPGKIDEEYVAQLRQCLDWAHQSQLSVYLDMHQDCYSYRVDDYGAKANSDALEWQAIADGLPHENPGSVWSDAYLQSPAVKRMFDNLWANREASDNMGLQDHYAFAWRELAGRLVDHPALVGYDLMNEPSPGSVGETVMARILLRGAIALFLNRGRLVHSLDEITNLWMDADERSILTDLLSNPSRFRRVIRAGRHRLHRAEKTMLAPFYEKVAGAIRDVDSARLIMTEPLTSEFMGMGSSLPRPKAAGRQSAWVPHVYDIVVDTDNEASFSGVRIAGIVSDHLRDAARRGEPCLIGEWGAFRIGFGNNRMAETHRELFEKNLLGDSYWCYEHDAPISLKSPYIRGLHRPVIGAAAGTVVRTSSSQAGVFNIEWEQDPCVTEPTVIYIPGGEISSEGAELEATEVYPEGAFYRLQASASRPDERQHVSVSFAHTAPA